MSAKDKLNAAHLTGAVVIAAIVAALFQSWSVFFLAVIVLCVTGFIAGDIRQ